MRSYEQAVDPDTLTGDPHPLTGPHPLPTSPTHDHPTVPLIPKPQFPAALTPPAPDSTWPTIPPSTQATGPAWAPGLESGAPDSPGGAVPPAGPALAPGAPLDEATGPAWVEGPPSLGGAEAPRHSAAPAWMAGGPSPATISSGAPATVPFAALDFGPRGHVEPEPPPAESPAPQQRDWNEAPTPFGSTPDNPFEPEFRVSPSVLGES
jgi:hypothetical protein